ncbi:hypothetical protein F5X68DRAFT_239822 [Plectosphaerella plurivora]|uniref:Uncharacterized protein n=1 Tax=Plectosphaerella plurivora TaxID=936078 RepID=A0A9P9ABV5_9PEZI|nr:hypothetical protein F5X68DRAFT_239822 [Plectosphaerella plurivora]
MRMALIRAKLMHHSPQQANRIFVKPKGSSASSTVWLFEILTTIASLLFLAAIVGIFYYVDGKPLSVWTDKISLNATISILTTACTVALMHGVSEFISQHKWSYFKTRAQGLESFEQFDKASRGVGGSLSLIFSVGWNLATLGAFITLARLALAPMAQQVVKIEQRVTSAPNDNATFGFAHAYTRNLQSLAFVTADSIPQDPQMQAAIVQGLYNLETPAIFSCPGTCSWSKPYTSLGFKTECKNVTESTIKSIACNDDGVYPIVCNMTTPAGLGLSTQHVPTQSGTNYRMNVSTLSNDPDTPLVPVDMPSGFPLLAHFAVYRSTSDGNYAPYDINITDCSLSLTAYEYSGARADGNEFKFDKTREVEIGGDNPWEWESGIINGLFYTNASDATGVPALETSWQEIKALQNFFTSETIATEWVDGDFPNKNPGLSAALTGNVDLEARFEQMAAKMTDYLRAGPNGQLARGNQTEAVPFITIQWVWMAGPAAIEVLVLIFAIATIFDNRKSRDIPVWKSSALAVLACQHDETTGTLQSRMTSIDELKKVEGKKQARLESW